MNNEAPTFRDLQRRLSALIPGVPVLEDAATAPALEISAPAIADPPRLAAASLIEDKRLCGHRVPAEHAAGFAAFLDGTQSSRVLQYAGVTPAIVGTVGSVIRVRRNGRLATWKMISRKRLYAPLSILDETWAAAVHGLGLPVVDLPLGSGESAKHPFAIRDLAMHQVQRDREAVERELALAWCKAPEGVLYVDGGLQGDDRIAKSSDLVGVVKSHRTLFIEAADLPCLLGLREGERSSVFTISSPQRSAVASWYLRIRNAVGRDPLWGLVRIEASAARVSGAAVARESGLISTWVLAERTPVSAPDSRWDTMAYGIRDCEEFLRAAAVA